MSARTLKAKITGKARDLAVNALVSVATATMLALAKVQEGAQEGAATRAASLEQKGGSSLRNAPRRVAHSEM